MNAKSSRILYSFYTSNCVNAKANAWKALNGDLSQVMIIYLKINKNTRWRVYPIVENSSETMTIQAGSGQLHEYIYIYIKGWYVRVHNTTLTCSLNGIYFHQFFQIEQQLHCHH